VVASVTVIRDLAVEAVLVVDPAVEALEAVEASEVVLTTKMAGSAVLVVGVAEDVGAEVMSHFIYLYVCSKLFNSAAY